MKNLNKMRKELYFEMKTQQEYAWKEKDFDKATKLREKEQINYEKLQLLNGLIVASEKGNKHDKK